MKKVLQKKLRVSFYFVVLMMSISASAQNIFFGEPVQVVGSFNGYATNPYNSDYRTTAFRRVSVNTGNPTDGRGQWMTTINVQPTGGNVTPVNMTGGAGNGFLFISGPSSNRFQNKWVFSGVGSGTVGAINAISAFNSGNDMGLNMSLSGRYTFVFNDAGYTQTNAKYYVGYTTNNPVSLSSTGVSYSSGQPVISVSTSATPSVGENIYVRYRVGTNDFTSGTSVVQATGSGTTWTATLPAQSCATTVYFYVYSSTRTSAQINSDSESDRTLATLRYDDNSGANYSFTLPAATTYYLDADNDSFGSSLNSIVSCTGAPIGYVSNNTDCNDNQLQYLDFDGDGFGSTTQVACGVANNIDTNDNLLTYVDNDGDGFGSTTLAPNGVTNNLDCNDNQIQYADVDGDGFGSITQVACGVLVNTDCDDSNFNANPNVTEICNGIDDNCDGNIDEGVAPACQNGATVVNCGCVCPSGYAGILCQIAVDSDSDGVPDISDCSPSNPLIYQSALLYTDVDGDGFHVSAAVTCYGATLPAGTSLTTLGFGDCNDNNSAVNPGATEVCYDGLDNDCDGTIDEGCTPIVSVVQPSQCGVTLATINQNIFANLVPGAQGYRFTVTDMTTMQVQSIDKALRVFQLTQLGTYAFARTYQIQVSIRFNNVWQPFVGSACLVTTPAAVTQVQAAQCNGQLTTMSDVIYADNVPFASGYRFRITNLLTSASVEVERLTRDVRLNNITGFTPEFNTTYSVEVAVKNTNGTYLPYNPLVCNVTTPSFPTTQLQLSQCDVTISNPNTTIFADSYVGATTYRFRFVNGAFTYTFDRPLRSFILSSIPVPAGATYSVQVSIEINGVFGPYGKICTLTIPGGARGNDAVAGNDFQAIASPNPFASNFGLNLSTSSEELVHVRVFNMMGKLVDDRKAQASDIVELGDNYPSGVYNVIVSQAENTKTVRVIKR